MLVLGLCIMLTLQSSVKVCTALGHDGKLCLGSVGQHRAQVAQLTVYTRGGTKEAEHVERRCRSCSTGYWHGYFTKVRQNPNENRSNKSLIKIS